VAQDIRQTVEAPKTLLQGSKGYSKANRLQSLVQGDNQTRAAVLNKPDEATKTQFSAFLKSGKLTD